MFQIDNIQKENKCARALYVADLNFIVSKHNDKIHLEKIYGQNITEQDIIDYHNEVWNITEKEKNSNIKTVFGEEMWQTENAEIYPRNFENYFNKYFLK